MLIVFSSTIQLYLSCSFNLNTIYLYLPSDLFTFNISKKRVLKWQLFSQNIEEEGSSFFI